MKLGANTDDKMCKHNHPLLHYVLKRGTEHGGKKGLRDSLIIRVLG